MLKFRISTFFGLSILWGLGIFLPPENSCAAERPHSAVAPLPQNRSGDPRQQEMIADSIRYLQKSIPKNQRPASAYSRLVPVATVVSGLLEAGVSPEEPIVQEGLVFLARMGKELDREKDHAAFVLTQRCLKKAKAKTHPTCPKNISAQSDCALANALDQWVVSPGLGQAVRIRDIGQPSVQNERPVLAEYWKPAEFGRLIAKCLGRDDAHSKSPQPRKSEQGGLRPEPVLFSGGRKNDKDELTIPATAPTITECFASNFRGIPSLSNHLLSSNFLSGLRTTRLLI